MQIPETPINESDRLAALYRYNILDTLPEQEYDDLTQLAADICGTPIALISLVDCDRQWFKSRVGIEATETPKDISFCGHAVVANETLNVPDAALDPRFADNPLVVNEPHIRFYAGVPLRTADNFPLGTLCVIDRVPRNLTPIQIRQLEALSRLVISHLEFRLKEEKLAQVSTVQQAILDSANFSVISTDLEGNIQSFNACAESILGYKAIEIIGKSPATFHDIDEISECAQQLSVELNQTIAVGFEVFVAKVKLGQIFEREWTYIHKNGDRFPALLSITAIRNRAGEITGFLGVAKDLSAQKQAEKQAKDITEALDQTAIVSITDIQGSITFANDKFCGISKYTYPELIGQNLRILNSGYHSDQFFVNLWQTISSGKTWHGEIKNRAKDGSFYWVDTTIVPFMDKYGKPFQYLAIGTDITDRKRAEFQLQKNNEELLCATRLKDEFLASMSHELRTPLNAILGMTEGLQEGIFGIVNDRQIKALQTVENSGNHLLTLINDILDVSKIESGQMTLDLTLSSVQHLCKSSITFINQQALSKKIQIIERIPANLPDQILDERRIRQVLINLLHNAVKFSDAGGIITLAVTLLSAEDCGGKTFLRFTIQDTGIGIAPENIKKLFQPFIQIDSALNRKYEGSGLGLALVKRIVELHGGRVSLTSELGVGSCFAIELPCANSVFSTPQPESQINPIPELQPIQSSPPRTSPLILLAEDNEANISTIFTYLEAKGYRILIAQNGQDAIFLAKIHQPDLILMDIQMPVMDGLEATKQIRLESDLTDIPIIALTALAMEGDRDRCLAAGANEYISKPVKLKQLDLLIQNLL